MVKCLEKFRNVTVMNMNNKHYVIINYIDYKYWPGNHTGRPSPATR